MNISSSSNVFMCILSIVSQTLQYFLLSTKDSSCQDDAFFQEVSTNKVLIEFMTRRDLKEKKKEKCLPYFGQKSLLMLQTSKVRSFLGGQYSTGNYHNLYSHHHISQQYVVFCSTKQIFLTEMMYYGLVQTNLVVLVLILFLNRNWS